MNGLVALVIVFLFSLLSFAAGWLICASTKKDMPKSVSRSNSEYPVCRDDDETAYRREREVGRI